MRIIFFGTGTFAALILRDIVQQKDWSVELVVTEPARAAGRGSGLRPSEVNKVASEKKLPLLAPQTLKDHEVYEAIISQGAEVMVVTDYGNIIPPTIFGYPPFGTINVHPSLLPKLRGPSPIQYALVQGLDETGVSLIIIDEKVDHGPLLSQEKLKIAPGDTYLTLEKKLADLGSKLLLRDVPLYLKRSLKPKTQNHQEATFTRKIEKEQGRVNWALSAQEIYNLWRAFLRWPGIFTFGGGKRLNLIKISLVSPPSQENSREPGLLFVASSELLVQCGEGVIRIDQIQPEGKTVLAANEFINGYRHLLDKKLS